MKFPRQKPSAEPAALPAAIDDFLRIFISGAEQVGPQMISTFQDLVYETRRDRDPIWEIVCTLAYDLEYVLADGIKLREKSADLTRQAITDIEQFLPKGPT